MPNGRAADWLRQAQSDFAWGNSSLAGGHFSQTCFVAQQVAEKAAKAIAFHRGAEIVRSHSVFAIARELKVNGPLAEAARRLDQYYVAARYPDAQPAGAPFELFTEDQAVEALAYAKRFIDAAVDEVDDG